ncbi:HdeD family acid-resistance protein [Methanoregula sp.]|uniref:HdeD family acid-resistance protein n=1 Tax=Methanoregula sp. TaxID=2052170 RepID=UPI003BAFEF2C
MTETTATPELCGCSCRCGAPGLFPWWILFLWGILALLIGIMFLASPGITLAIFITFLGAYWLIGGIFSLASLAVDRTNMGWKICIALLNLIAGIIILAHPLYSTFFLTTFFIVIIGVWACITGGAHMYHAFSQKDTGNAILGIVSFIFGLLLLVVTFIFPLISVVLLALTAGIFAIIIGIAAIVTSFSAKKAIPMTPAP